MSSVSTGTPHGLRRFGSFVAAVAFVAGAGFIGYLLSQSHRSTPATSLEGGELRLYPSPAPTFLVLEDAEAWACLPARTHGEQGPLPHWARATARTLPHTTAAMLELDYLHRARSTLDPKLRGQIRLVVANYNGSNYGRSFAITDLHAAGTSESESIAWSSLPEDTQAVLLFARQLVQAPHDVTDAQVRRLIERHGEKQVVAMVLCVAYANFQDRLFRALGLQRPESAMPPLDVRFARRTFATESRTPPRRPPDTALVLDGGLRDPDWIPDNLTDVQEGLKAQRAMKPRIALPAERGVNLWGLVGQAYQPELAAAWSACTQAFGEEADQDPVFEQSLFWIVTRTTRCFY